MTGAPTLAVKSSYGPTSSVSQIAEVKYGELLGSLSGSIR